MDTVTAFISMRFAERIFAVVIGGLSIYLGYRLFLEVPQRHDSSGKVILPFDVTVILTRVGPGVFFALFGAAVVGSSFFKGMAYGDLQRAIEHSGSPPGIAAETMTLKEHSTTVSGVGAGSMQGGNLNEERALLRREIAIMNAVPANLKPGLAKAERDEIVQGMRRTKLALMRSVWDSTDWGPLAEFESWIARDEPDPVPASIASAVKYYRYTGGSPKP